MLLAYRVFVSNNFGFPSTADENTEKPHFVHFSRTELGGNLSSALWMEIRNY